MKNNVTSKVTGLTILAYGYINTPSCEQYRRVDGPDERVEFVLASSDRPHRRCEWGWIVITDPNRNGTCFFYICAGVPV